MPSLPWLARFASGATFGGAECVHAGRVRLHSLAASMLSCGI